MRTNGSQRTAGSGSDGAAPSVEVAVEAIMAATADHLYGRVATADLVAGRLAFLVRWPRVLHAGVAAVLRTQLERLWSAGWLPVDVHQVARRQADEVIAGLLAAAVAEATHQRPAATTHPRWFAQLRQLDVLDGWSSDRPYPAQWADRHGVDESALLAATVEAVTLALRLPVLPAVLPPPGQGGVGT
ncbi:hypothetical protein E1269_19505, partial [Jiangella asiatica]